MIQAAFLQNNKNIIFRPFIKDTPFEPLIHHFNNKRNTLEGKIQYKDDLIYFTSNNDNTFLAILTNKDIQNTNIFNLIKRILSSLNENPFDCIEDTLSIIDVCFNELGVYAASVECMKNVCEMDSYDEKVLRRNVQSFDVINNTTRNIQNVQNLRENVSISSNLKQNVTISNKTLDKTVNTTVITSSTNSLNKNDLLFKKYTDQMRKEVFPIKNNKNSVNFKVIEKISLKMDKEGSILKKEINGELILNILKSELKESVIKIKSKYNLKYSPNLIREYCKEGKLKAKNSFPIEKEVVLTRWKRDEEFDDFNFNLWKKEENNYIFDFEKKKDLNEILFFFREEKEWKCKENSGCREMRGDGVFPIKVYYCGRRKCDFDVVSVENEEFEVEYFYEADGVEIVE